MADHPLRPATHLRLGAPLPPQLANGPRAPPQVDYSFPLSWHPTTELSGISVPFGTLSQALGQVTHVLRTRPPLGIAPPLDLHVLGTPPTFVLSQDQTRQLNPARWLSPSALASLFFQTSLSTRSSLPAFAGCLFHPVFKEPLSPSATLFRAPSSGRGAIVAGETQVSTLLSSVRQTRVVPSREAAFAPRSPPPRAKIVDPRRSDAPLRTHLSRPRSLGSGYAHRSWWGC